MYYNMKKGKLLSFISAITWTSLLTKKNPYLAILLLENFPP